jgi:hypothetical protein
VKAATRPVVQEIRSVVRGDTHTHHVLRNRLALLTAATLLVDAVGTTLMYLFEHGRAASGFHDVGGALFWVTAQLTTVSSQMPNPVTTPGRVIDIVLEVWAISAVATLAASLGSFFVVRHHELHGAPDRRQPTQPT